MDGQMVTKRLGGMQYHSHERIHPQRTLTAMRRDSPDDSSDDKKGTKRKRIS